MKRFRSIFAAAFLAALSACSGTVDPEQEGAEEGPDAGTSVPELSSGYFQKMIGMQFTSVGCTNCPLLSEAIRNIQAENPDCLIPVAFHMDYEITDPMTLGINRKFYDMVDLVKDNTLGLPMFALNFRAGSQHIVNEYAKISAEMKLQASQHPASCGVALKVEYDEALRKLAVKARFKSDVSASYRYHILLLEDGIEYAQMGDESGNYVHDNVLRHVSADDVRGANLNSGKALTPGEEYAVEKTFTLDEAWNAERIKVVAALLKEDEKGVWGSYNANVCAPGGSVDYLYGKDE